MCFWLAFFSTGCDLTISDDAVKAIVDGIGDTINDLCNDDAGDVFVSVQISPYEIATLSCGDYIPTNCVSGVMECSEDNDSIVYCVDGNKLYTLKDCAPTRECLYDSNAIPYCSTIVDSESGTNSDTDPPSSDSDSGGQSTDSVVDSDSESETEVDTGSEVESDTTVDSDSDTVLDSDSESDTEIDTGSEVESESDTGSSDTDTDSDVDSDSDNRCSGFENCASDEVWNIDDSSCVADPTSGYETEILCWDRGVNATEGTCSEIVVSGCVYESPSPWRLTVETPACTKVSGLSTCPIVFPEPECCFTETVQSSVCIGSAFCTDIYADEDTDTDTDTDVDSDSAVDTDSESDTELDTGSDIESDTAVDSESDIDSDTGSDSDTSSDTIVDSDTATDTNSESDTGSDSVSDSDSISDTGSDTISEIDSDTAVDSDSETDTGADSETDTNINCPNDGYCYTGAEYQDENFCCGVGQYCDAEPPSTNRGSCQPFESGRIYWAYDFNDFLTPLPNEADGSPSCHDYEDTWSPRIWQMNLFNLDWRPNCGSTNIAYSNLKPVVMHVCISANDGTWVSRWIDNTYYFANSDGCYGWIDDCPAPAVIGGCNAWVDDCPIDAPNGITALVQVREDNYPDHKVCSFQPTYSGVSVPL